MNMKIWKSWKQRPRSLAQETGLSVFRLLVEAGPEGVPGGQLAKALEVPPATLSFHLK
jgi:ArsR family transcriptional regulator, arsenate/arsenite/antimonite-responsive transcriptional repressor